MSVSANAAVPPALARGRTPGRGISSWRRFRRNRFALAGAVFLLLLGGACVLGPWLIPYSPVAMSLTSPYQPPTAAHPLGTDALGRDVWSRTLFGGRVDLGLSVLAVAVAASGGACTGLLAGYLGGAVEGILMRIVDVLLAIPDLLLALALVAFIGPSVASVVLILAFSRMPRYARLVRGSVLGLKQREFVMAATALGASRMRIVARHLAPALSGTIVVYATLDLGGVLGALAGLSFIGVGIQPPAAEWGRALADARQNLVLAPWTAVFPGLAITLCVVAFNLAGDGMRDALDARVGGRSRQASMRTPRITGRDGRRGGWLPWRRLMRPASWPNGGNPHAPW